MVVAVGVGYTLIVCGQAMEGLESEVAGLGCRAASARAFFAHSALAVSAARGRLRPPLTLEV